jgi:hypothetical protein
MLIILLGVLLEEKWPFLVCRLPDRIPVHFILLGSLFKIIGDSTAVSPPIMHIITRISSEDKRTFSF